MSEVPEGRPLLPDAGPARLLTVEDLSVTFHRRGSATAGTGPIVKAVNGVSFDMDAGDCLGLVGESGSGKSSIARALVRVVPSRGRFILKGVDFFALKGEALREARREIQMIFQNPQGSLDPRQTAREVIQEPLAEHRLVPRPQMKARVEELMDQVGFNPALAERYAHQLSGGQCQRLAIARSLGLGAELLICDEPTSALDVSVQAQIINLLKDLTESQRTSYLFISHNLGVVRQLATKVAVLYRGRIVESASAPELFAAPKHPYTLELLGSELIDLAGPQAHLRPGPDGAPDVAGHYSAVGTGCSFAHLCPYAVGQCRQEAPTPEVVMGDHVVECHRWRVIEGDARASAAE